MRLHKCEENYRQFFENADFIVVKTDNSGKILYLNNFAEEFFGYKNYELYNKAFYDSLFSTKNKLKE
ncbi:MAG: PAS domain-containing protein [Methanogenium sp.]|nr:PAS domain-containing protein [Methanogenium sp.]